MNWEPIGSLIGDIGDATSILITAKMEVGKISAAVNTDGNILENSNRSAEKAHSNILKKAIRNSLVVIISFEVQKIKTSLHCRFWADPRCHVHSSQVPMVGLKT